METLAGLALAALGGLIWLLRLEGRVNVHEQRIDDMKSDLTYIRDRIDEAIKRWESA